MGKIYRGNTEISALYRGQSAVSKVYRGNTLIWEPSSGGGIVTDGLDHYYSTLDAGSWPGSGTTWYDLIGTNSVDLTMSGTLGTDTFSGITAMDFDQLGDEAIGTMGYTKTYSNGLTVEAWIWYNGGKITADDKGLITQFAWKQSAQSNVTYHTIGTSGTFINKPQAYIAWASSNRGHHPSDSTLSLGSWQHTAFTIAPGSTNNLIFYNNGSADGTDSVPCSSFNVDNSGQTIRVGQEENNGRQFVGGIAVIRFYDKVLTPSEIAQNYAAGVV